MVSLMTTLLDTMIREAAERHGLPIAAVKAICRKESSLGQHLYRYEPHYKWLVTDGVDMTPTERAGQMASWGVMQIMGATARERGYVGRDFIPFVQDHTVGLEYGCRHLAYLWHRYKHWPAAIAAYNAGSPRQNGDGTYENQGYVNDVLRFWNEYDVTAQIKAL